MSPRCEQVFRLLIEGLGEKQIGLALGISVNTVHEYVKRVYRWFDVDSRAELLAHVIRVLAEQLGERPDVAVVKAQRSAAPEGVIGAARPRGCRGRCASEALSRTHEPQRALLVDD